MTTSTKNQPRPPLAVVLCLGLGGPVGPDAAGGLEIAPPQGQESPGPHAREALSRDLVDYRGLMAER